MHIVRFVKSATRKCDYPKGCIPEIAFVGRSNVGKSSLINCLVGRKDLARTSSTPGRTQVINYFSVNDRWMLVDLPGYGFAKVPARVRAQWAPMIEEFFTTNTRLRLTVVIVDSRHKPTILDREMIDWLKALDIPFQVVATKVDKSSKSRRSDSLRLIRQSLGVTEAMFFSAKTGEGRKRLWSVINRLAEE